MSSCGCFCCTVTPFSSSLFSRTCCSSVCLSSLECSPLLFVYLYGQLWQGHQQLGYMDVEGEMTAFLPPDRSFPFTTLQWMISASLAALRGSPRRQNSLSLASLQPLPVTPLAETPLALVAHTAGPGCVHPGLSPVAGPVSCLLLSSHQQLALSPCSTHPCTGWDFKRSWA